MQPHFVCSECGFLSKLSGTCQNEDCIKSGELLARCFCEDGQHSSVLKHSSVDDVESLSDQEQEAKNDDYSAKTLDLDDPKLE